MKFEKLINLLFYSTGLVSKEIRTNLIQRPIQKTAIFLYPKSRTKELKKYNRYIKSQNKLDEHPKTSRSITDIYKWMILSTSIIVGILLSNLITLLKLNFEYMDSLVLWGSILTFFCIYKEDKYIAHFERLKWKTPKRMAVILFVYFHIVPFLIGIYLIID